MTRSLQKRLRMFTFAVIFVALLLTARLAWLQIYKYDHYLGQAENNRLRDLPITATRGEIRDRNGISLATNRPGFSVSLLDLDRQKAAEVIDYLSETLEIEKEEIQEKILQQQYKRFAPIRIANDVSAEIVAKLEEHAMDLPGVIIETQPVREYPLQTLAAHVLGYVGVIRDYQYEAMKAEGYRFTDIIGQAGLESTYEQYLHGQDGILRIETDRFGNRVRVLERTEPVGGNDLELTLDTRLQEIAARSLAQGIADLQKKGNTQASRGAVVALDPNTGGILAMVSFPGFNPNTFFNDYKEIQADPNKPEINKAIQGTYPVGSTFKLVGTLAALEEGVITEKSRVTCVGVKSFFGSDRRRCFNSTAHGHLNIIGALQKSCNIFFYEMGYRLGIERLAAYAHDFGFGKVTGLTDIRGEVAGVIDSKERRSNFMPGDVLTAAIGQGHAITPLQLANYAAILANHGTHYRPYLVEKALNGKGKVVYEAKPEVLNTLPYSEKNWELARTGMKAVTEPGGTGAVLRTVPVKVAGKTGSAQVSAGKISHSLFVGYAPADNPEVALAVIVENGGLGGDGGVPVAKLIFEEYFALAEMD
ncbi:MAG TPA: penicillin-binding protein 2 [Oscillospiraceae bacterium]|nr:penicillin-binding protein 2 [Oscillospiraceae bacterium]